MNRDLLKILMAPKKKIIQELLNKKAIASPNGLAWLVYKGKGLPCLVCHIDTVYEWDTKGNKEVIYGNGYYWSPHGVGGDDRCGVYALLKLLEQGIEANFLFCDLEEKGGKGAMEACLAFEKELQDTLYFLEIDRRGYKEAVFYNGEEAHKEFVKAISQFFQIGRGTFSDISILGERFEICGANLSAGFYYEHQRSGEYIYEPHLQYTIETIPKLIEKLGDKQYKLPARKYWSYLGWDTDYYTGYRYYDDREELLETFYTYQKLFPKKVRKVLKENKLSQKQVESLDTEELYNLLIEIELILEGVGYV